MFDHLKVPDRSGVDGCKGVAFHWRQREFRCVARTLVPRKKKRENNVLTYVLPPIYSANNANWHLRFTGGMFNS